MRALARHSRQVGRKPSVRDQAIRRRPAITPRHPTVRKGGKALIAAAAAAGPEPNRRYVVARAARANQASAAFAPSAKRGTGEFPGWSAAGCQNRSVWAALHDQGCSERRGGDE